MAFKQKDNSGALFKNKEKTPDNKVPDYKGTILINGEEYWQSAWLHKAEKTGEFYMSQSFQKKEKARTKASDFTNKGGKADEDDEIPFS